VYDLVIVGAGPAGATAAIVATRLGLRTLVVDRFKPPREKPCGGGLTPRTWRMLERMGIEYSWYGECREVRVKVADINYTHRGDPIRVTRRPEFDKALLDQSGAEFAVDRVLRVEGGRAVGERGAYEGAVVVGAAAPTARWRDPSASRRRAPRPTESPSCRWPGEVWAIPA